MFKKKAKITPKESILKEIADLLNIKIKNELQLKIGGIFLVAAIIFWLIFKD